MAPKGRLSPRQEAPGPHDDRSPRQHGIRARSQLAPPGIPEKPIYTRTGRISKAKKGLSVHHCLKCGRTYTRAEHLRRHSKNHEEEPLRCKFPGCGKKFHREDLLQRHEERHTESRAASVNSPPSGPELEPSLSAPTTTTTTPTLPASIADVTVASLYSTNNLALQQQDMVTRPNSRKTRASSSSHTYVRSAAPIPTEGYAPFQDSWSPTQPYSSSSGYASPGYDYNNIAHANTHQFDPSMRTRTSSDASLAEPWHPYQHPLSPVSTASSLLFTWTEADKSPGLHALGLPVSEVPTSFNMAGSISAPTDPLAGLVMFPLTMKTHATRDEDEGKILFPDESFGLISDMYQSAHYMEQYWHYFHPNFPIIHKATFELDPEAQAPLLRAAMMAIGAQYSEQPNSNANSRSLHERCVKLLNQRDLDVSLPQRTCDMQAIFLVEYLSQYRGRRASPQLSNRFTDVYMTLSHDTEIIPTSILDDLSTVAPTADAHTQYTQWKEWIRISSKQRLFTACFILEAQQSTLLSRKLSTTVFSGFELPVPASTMVWDAESAPRWAALLQQNPSTIRYVYEISTQYVPPQEFNSLDAFQSALLIFTHYDPFNSTNSFFTVSDHPALSQILDTSTQTQLLFLTSQLSQTAPIRDLLAVSGESWILHEKIAVREIFETHKQALAGWVSKLWLPDASADMLKPVRPAVKLSIQILRLALDVRPGFKLTIGTEMGLYFAALVLWAVTCAAASRWQRSNTPAPPAPTSASPPAIGLSDPASQSIDDLERESFHFLHLASTGIDLPSSRVLLDEAVLKQWQDGVCALMKLLGDRLGGSSTTSGGSAHGELLDGVVGVLKKLAKQSNGSFPEIF